MALGYLEKALALERELPEAHFELGECLREMDRGEEAIFACKRSVMLDPFQAKVHHRLGELLKEKLYHDQALTSLEEAAKLDPEDLDIARDLAVVLGIAGRQEEALDYTGLASQFLEMYAEGGVGFYVGWA